MKILIIGCGGVTGYMMPAFNRTYAKAQTVLMDGDVLEERNLERQLFSPKCLGMNKAAALNKTHGTKHKVVPSYYAGSEPFDEDLDFIICAADNHKCRRDIMSMMDMQKHRAVLIMGVNETEDAQAFVYRTHWKNDGKKDPRVRYAEILTDNSGHPFLRCTDTAVLDAAPQTATANMRAAAAILWLLNAWDRDISDPTGLPVEIYQTRTNTKVTRHEY